MKNAKALAEALKKQGFKLLTDGTDNHLMLIDLRGMDVSCLLYTSKNNCWWD